MDAAAGLRALLSKLTSTPGPAAVEAALMLGRLGAILGNHCEKLALVLGPPEEWDACKPGVSGKDARRDRKFMHMRRNASSDAKTKGALPSKGSTVSTNLGVFWGGVCTKQENLSTSVTGF